MLLHLHHLLIQVILLSLDRQCKMLPARQHVYIYNPLPQWQVSRCRSTLLYWSRCRRTSSRRPHLQQERCPIQIHQPYLGAMCLHYITHSPNESPYSYKSILLATAHIDIDIHILGHTLHRCLHRRAHSRRTCSTGSPRRSYMRMFQRSAYNSLSERIYYQHHRHPASFRHWLPTSHTVL